MTAEKEVPRPDSGGATALLDALRASGEVGEHLAAVDWAATPLGDPTGWDSGLATIVRAVVSSRFSMWMAWGPELTFFCNDAYRRDTLGAKYPWALGRPSREVWAEIWDDIGPRIEQVLSTGQATWDQSLPLFLERSGYPEETYHTFSYSPLADDRGAIAGMLCVVTEETERVVGERRMDTLRVLGAVESGGRDERAYLTAVAEALGTNDRSLPFTAIYLVDDAGDATLAGTSGVAPGAAVAPERIAADDPAPVWPLAQVMAGEFLYVEGLTERFGAAEVPTGHWPEPPEVAAVMPLPAQVPGARPVGFLVAGANKYRPVDDSYRVFIELLAGQVAAGVASARAFATERTRAEELARLDAAKTTFFTNVSHELRTPLTLLLAPAEDLLAGGGPRTPGERQRLELIVANAQRLLKLVNTLLDFSRLETGRDGASFEPVDLSAYTLELASMFESAFVRAGLTLELDCPPLAKPVWVDREMWAKVVLNLVSNALKYTLEGTVTVRLRDVSGGVCLHVVDTGIGIGEEDQTRLFERFHRVEGSSGRSFEGTGIGLALVAELVATHGGYTTVQSTPGEGSTFGVELPYGPEHLPAGQLAPEGVSSSVIDNAVATYLAEVGTWTGAEVPGADAAPVPDPVAEARAALGDRPAPEHPDALPPRLRGDDGTPPRILVVDDNANMRNYVTTLLADHYTVQTAADGEAGLAAAVAAAPDLILTDVMMPRMNGFELLAALRRDPRTVHIPVLMLSARAGEEGMVEGLEAGADDYLVKPFSARELHARVAANLELDRVRRVRDQLRNIQELQDQAERLAEVGSWEADLRASRFRTSAQFRAMLNVSEAELAQMGLSEAVMAYVVEEDRGTVSSVLEAAVASGTPFEYETRLIGREDRQMRIRGEVIRDEAGEAIAVRGFMQDITAQRAAEQAVALAAAAQQAAEREHAIADELQRSLLPDADLSSDRLEVAAFYRPGVEGTRAGGDFYDVIDLGGTRTAVVIGDVSGRGVRAASLMGQLRAAIHAHARLDLPPAEVLEQLDTLVRDLGHRSLVTCIYGIHDSLVQTFVYANAGHLPPLMRNGEAEVTLLPGASGPPLGVGGAHFGEHTVHFAPGSTLVLYTDGLVERRRVPIDDNIGLAGTVLADAEVPLEALPEHLVDALGAEGIDDDVAILAVTSVGADDEYYAEHDVAAAPSEVRKARRWAAGVLDSWEVPEVTAQDVVTIVSELVTNAITYGRPPVRLRLRMNAQALLVEVDDGLSALPRRARMDIHGERGRGLWIVSQLASRWSARPNGAGKTVWCSVTLPAARRASWSSSAH